MAGVYKRASDKKRGKAGRWTISWIDVNGKRRSTVGFTDKAQSLALAIQRENDARMVREGLVSAGDVARREASGRPLSAHIEDYRLALLAKGDTANHAKRVAGALTRIFELAEVRSITDLAPDRIQLALGGLRDRFSPRTANFSLGTLKAFAKWADESDRIALVPKGIRSLRRFNEELHRSKVRRSMTKEEVDRLFETARVGPKIVAARTPRTGDHTVTATLTGPEREAIYRVAAGTGFRAEEIRSLTPADFQLDGDEPAVRLRAEAAKNRKERVQPIRRELAAYLRPILEKKPRREPAFILPAKTADMLRADLAAALIPVTTSEGELDFHALRGTFITALIESGANIKVVQELARHSSIVLTMKFYAKAPKKTTRDALEGD